MGEFLQASAAQQLDNRGGKLQIAGQVVATWGPRPGQPATNHQQAATNYTSLQNSQHTDTASNYKTAPSGNKVANKKQPAGKNVSDPTCHEH